MAIVWGRSKRSDGTRLERNVRLLRPVGDGYYLMTGFDLNKNGEEDVAIVDISKKKYRWHVVVDPLSKRPQVKQHFSLGTSEDRLDWAWSAKRQIEFIALQQGRDNSLAVIKTRNARTRNRRNARYNWSEPRGFLLPTRLKRGSGNNPGLALYAPAKHELLLLKGKGRFDVRYLPEQGCSGFQAITGLSRGRNL